MQLSVRSFAAQTKKLIEAGRLDAALHEIHDFVERIVSEPLCAAIAFGSARLDDLCRRIGEISLRELNAVASQPTPDTKPTIIYIVTKLQNSGGHSRVLNDLIRTAPEAQHVILSTELAGRSDSISLGTGLPSKTSLKQEIAPRTTFAGRLKWLQQRLLALAPRRVYLFNHHQDPIAIAALPPEIGIETWFYHHADHHLALGVLSPHFTHIDPHPMGYENCRHRMGIENRYLPLTCEDHGMRASSRPFRTGGTLTTCTAARANKIEKSYPIEYADVITSLLQSTCGRHIHIGRLTPWMLFTLRRKLRHVGVAPERFVYIPWVASVWKALGEYEVDLYISSFPYGGGLTLIEAMGSGTPIAVHKHIYSRLLCGIDMAHEQTLAWREPEVLIEYCRGVTPEALTAQSVAGRARYDRYHHPNRLTDALTNPEQPQPPGAGEEFQVETDELAIWMEQQVSCVAVARRTLYRLFKRLRARFG